MRIVLKGSSGDFIQIKTGRELIRVVSIESDTLSGTVHCLTPTNQGLGREAYLNVSLLNEINPQSIIIDLAILKAVSSVHRKHLFLSQSYLVRDRSCSHLC